MNPMFQERSLMSDTSPKPGLKEDFLKNENLGNKKIIYSFIIYLVIH